MADASAPCVGGWTTAVRSTHLPLGTVMGRPCIVRGIEWPSIAEKSKGDGTTLRSCGLAARVLAGATSGSRRTFSSGEPNADDEVAIPRGGFAPVSWLPRTGPSAGSCANVSNLTSRVKTRTLTSSVLPAGEVDVDTSVVAE